MKFNLGKMKKKIKAVQLGSLFLLVLCSSVFASNYSTHSSGYIISAKEQKIAIANLKKLKKSQSGKKLNLLSLTSKEKNELFNLKNALIVFDRKYVLTKKINEFSQMRYARLFERGESLDSQLSKLVVEVLNLKFNSIDDYDQELIRGLFYLVFENAKKQATGIDLVEFNNYLILVDTCLQIKQMNDEQRIQDFISQMFSQVNLTSSYSKFYMKKFAEAFIDSFYEEAGNLNDYTPVQSDYLSYPFKYFLKNQIDQGLLKVKKTEMDGL